MKITKKIKYSTAALLIITAVLMSFSSCAFKPLDTVNIHIAGSYFDGSRWVAFYWNDDVKTDLTDGTNSAYAYSIFVSEGDVYIAGEEDEQACFWKNGEQTYLANGLSASSVTVKDGDIYISGSIEGSADSCYWKNGVQTILSVSNDWSSTSDIAVSGNDIYVAGRYGDYHTDLISAPCYWKNGNLITLQTPSDRNSADSIAVEGSDVYVSGAYDIGVDGYRACYWLNGERSDLVGQSANSVYIFESDVYIAGKGTNTTCYWENEEKTALPANQPAHAHDIYVTNDGVFTVGDAASGSERTLCYWQDDVRTDLFTDQGADGAAIFITEL